MKDELLNYEFGSLVFGKSLMKERLPEKIYNKWLSLLNDQGALDMADANIIAEAMKDWAIEKGCTHYCHWFQPLTGSTAEKHEAFIDKDTNNNPILKFSGKSLVKGETDGSSFPSGGLRSTFEARGYTYWDYTSYAFIRDKVLCIPSVYASYNGEFLDKKGPLLKSISLVNEKACTLMNLLGYEDVKRVYPNIGLEQEFFLVDRDLYKRREDMIISGRTLFGAYPAKRQELSDHYFGAIPSRVIAFMNDVDQQLWKLGIYVKTEHNEVAPGQFELAPIFGEQNMSVDQNLVIMDILKRVAHKHRFVCLLHEKPFRGINGSGKHNNYSLSTDTGINLFDAGKTRKDQLRFLLFISLFVKAVDKYPELLRLSTANPGNDQRLGQTEAPPAIVSIFLGSNIEEAVEKIIKEGDFSLDDTELVNQINGIVNLPKDNTDRNRTSPVAFTGNKFEFRMLGSSDSASTVNLVLNLILADVFDELNERLKKVKAKDKSAEIKKVIKENFTNHQRILFNGDGYGQKWVEEAESRGLPNFDCSIKAIAHYNDQKNIDLFKKYSIYTEKEVLARQLVLINQYINTVTIETNTLLNNVNQIIVPCIVKEMINYEEVETENAFIKKRIVRLNKLLEEIGKTIENIEKKTKSLCKSEDRLKRALSMRNEIVPLTEKLREHIDEYETIADKDIYKLPTYTDMLF